MFRSLSRTALAVLLFALAASAVAARQDKKDEEDPKDPVYDGKKASEWRDTLLNDSSARKRALAVEAMAKLWTEKRHLDSISSIGRALRVDSSVAVRAQAALALGGLRDAEVRYLIADQKSIGVKDLVDSMGTEKESRVRREIARSIGKFPVVAKLAVVQLTGALKDPEAGTRAAVAEALALAGPEGKSAASGLAPLLTDSDGAVRRAAVIALGRITPEGASAIAETMAKMLVTEKDADLRGEIVVSLGLLGDRSPAVVNALAAVLADPDEELRRRAARTLGTFGTSAAPAAEALLKVARTDTAKDIRVDAVHGFGSALGPAELKARVKDLVSLLADPDFEVRLAAVDGIGSLGYELINDKETMKVLRTRLSDSHVKVREAVAYAIKKIEKKPEPKKEPEPEKKP